MAPGGPPVEAARHWERGGGGTAARKGDETHQRDEGGGVLRKAGVRGQRRSMGFNEGTEPRCGWNEGEELRKGTGGE